MPSGVYERRKIGLRERIERQSIPEPNTGCWLWLGDTTVRRGYGRVHFPGGKALAHRASYQAFVGVIPSGLLVMHICDNPPCCNPAHLRLGTHRDNMDDRQQKGRTKPPAHVIGESVSSAILNDETVRLIRAEFASGAWTQSALARRWDVSPNTVSCLVRRVTWGHVDD